MMLFLSSKSVGWFSSRTLLPIHLVISIATFLAYSNSLNCGFTFDDNSAIVSNRYVHTNSTDWWSVFSVDYWGMTIFSEHSHKSYRPVTLLSFRFNYHLSQLKPFSYHLTNVILHLAVTLLFYKFSLTFWRNDIWPASLSTLFFALHPLKTEAVSGIVGRAELLSTFFTIFAIISYFDSAYLNFGTSVILATFSKEQSLTTPCVCMVFELILLWCQFRRLSFLPFAKRLIHLLGQASTWRLLSLIAFTTFLVGLRFVLTGFSLPVFTVFDNPASFEVTPIRQLTYNYLLPLNAYLMLYPASLCADWTMNSIPLVRQFDDPRNAWTVLFYLVAFILLFRAVKLMSSIRRLKQNEFFHKTTMILALVLIIVPFLPASNLFFPVGFVIAERCLYLPSVGYSLLLALGWARIRDYFGRLIRIVLYVSTITVLIVYGVRTYQRNFDWVNDLTLFESGLKVNPNNAKLYNNIGHFYEKSHQYDKAMNYFRMAAEKDHEDLGAELNIARTLIHLKQLGEAEKLLWAIKPRVRGSAIKNRIVPSYLNIWINLARVISLNDSRLSEAESLYYEVISVRRDFIDAYINLGEIYIRKSLFKQAIEIYETALTHAEFKNDFKVADLHYNIGIAKSLMLKSMETKHSARLSLSKKQKILEEIAKSFQNSIDINPDHREALINLAILIQKPEFPRVDLTKFREYVIDALNAYSKSEESEEIQFNIAITLLDLGGPLNRLKAIKHFHQAIKIKPDFRSSLYNLALLYYDFKDYNSSLVYLNQTLFYHSNYTKALLLIADIYSKLGKFDQTKQTYAKVLENDNDNFEARHNLCLMHKQQQQKNDLLTQKSENRDIDLESCLVFLKKSAALKML